MARYPLHRVPCCCSAWPGWDPECNSSAVGTYIHLPLGVAPSGGSTPPSRLLCIPADPWLPHGAPGKVAVHRLLAQRVKVVLNPPFALGQLAIGGVLLADGGLNMPPPALRALSGWCGVVLFFWGWSLWGLVGRGGCAPTRQASCPPCRIPRAVARSAMPPYRGIRARFGCFLFGVGPVPSPSPHPGLGSGLG